MWTSSELGAKPKREADVAVMTEVDCAANLVDFVNSGRTGRRNAVPDIENDKYCKVGTGSLTFDLEKLQCSDAPGRSDKEVSGGFGGAKEGASSGNSQGT